MRYEVPLFALLHFFSAGLAVVLILIVWQRRSSPARIPMIWLMAAAGWWALCAGMEVSALDYSTKILWAKLEYFSISSIAMLWLVFALHYSRMASWLTPWRWVFLGFIPLVTIGLVWTNELHGLIWSSVVPAAGSGGRMLVYGRGLWQWILVTYTYLCMLVGTLLLIRAVVRLPRVYVTQVVLLITAAVIPLLSHFIYFIGLSPVPGLELTPFGFAVCGLIFTYNLIGFRMFDLLPVAREAVTENMLDGVLVLDELGRLADFNPAAKALLGLDSTQDLGQPAELVFSNRPILVQQIKTAPGQWEFQDEASPDGIWLEGRTARVTDTRGQVGGKLIVLRDITARRKSEEAALAARQRAESLNIITQAIASRMEFSDFLDVAIRQLERFLPVDYLLAASYKSSVDDWRSERFLNPRGLTESAVHGLHLRLLKATAEARRPLLFHSRAELQSELGAALEVQGQPLTALMAAPMFASNEINGALLLYSTRTDRGFTADQFSFFASMASLAAIALSNQDLSKRVEELITRDPLTGLYNSRHFFELADLEVERALRYRSPLAALVIDLDQFNQINETYGRAAGDKVLYAVGQTLLHTMRKVDIIGRYGGEEFAILLPETSLDSASEAAARLCRLIAGMEIPHKEQIIHISASLGLASLEYGLTADTLMERANQAMRNAKRSGRNRVIIFEGRSPAG